MYCKKCGKETEDGLDVCPECGATPTDVDNIENSTPDIEEKAAADKKTSKLGNKTKIIIIAVISAVLVVAMIVATVIILSKDKKEDLPQDNQVQLEASQEEESKTNPADDIPMSTTSAKPLSDTSGFLKATDADFKDLDLLLQNLITSAKHRNGDVAYDANSPEAWEYATRAIFANGGGCVYDYCEERFSWKDTKKVLDFKTQKDPLGKFIGCGNDISGTDSIYHRIDGEKADWIYKNVFNVTPQHSKEIIKHDSGEYTSNDYRFYYNNGYYYFEFNQTNYMGMTVETKNRVQQSDGSYLVTIKTYFSNPDGAPNYEVRTALKNIDGKKVWSIYSISHE